MYRGTVRNYKEVSAIVQLGLLEIAEMAGKVTDILSL
jgi:hypothetical protein